MTGKVETGEKSTGVAGATVSIPALERSVQTDRAGIFVFHRMPVGNFTVVVSGVWFEKQERSITIQDSSSESRLDFRVVERPVETRPVVVTGLLREQELDDSPLSTDLISASEIQDLGVATLTEVMAEETGMELSYGIGRTQSAQVHGLSDSHVLILVDGQRVTGKVDGAFDLGQIPLHQIERIETVKGPLSSVYGSDALGGVINIITKKPDQSAPLAQVSLTGGNHGRWDASASLTHSFESLGDDDNNLSLALYSSANFYDGVDYVLSDNFSEVPGYDRYDLSLRSLYSIGDKATLDLKGSYYKDESEWLEGTKFNLFRDVANNERLGLTAALDWKLQGEGRVRFSYNHSANDHRLREFTKSGFVTLDNRNIENYQAIQAQYTRLIDETWLVALGSELSDESIESDRIVSNREKYLATAFFGEGSYYADEVTATLGARWSHNSVYGSFVAPKVSLMYDAAENLKLRLSYGRGYREPSLKELYIDFSNTVGYRVVGEPALGPESSHGFNAGIEIDPDEALSLKINAYYNVVADLINFYRTGEDGGRTVFSYENIDEAVTRGFDVDLSWQVSELLGASLGYAFTNAEDGEGNRLAFRIPHALNYKLAFSFDELKLRATIYGRVVDEQPVADIQSNRDIFSGVDEAQDLSVPAHGIVNARIEARLFDDLQLFGGVTNISNVTLYPYGQLKTREFHSGFRYTFH